MKKNEGFSLVELIVVVAIMAVLIGILAPAYLGYVEKTRKGTDENACEEIRGCIEKAIAGDLDVYDAVMTCMTDNTLTLTISTTGAIKDQANITAVKKDASSPAVLSDAIGDTFGSKALEFKSKEYKTGSCVVTIKNAGGNATEVGVKITYDTNKEKVIKDVTATE